MNTKWNKQWIVAVLTIILLTTLACGNASISTTQATEESAEDQAQESDPLPDEIYGTWEIDWKKGLADPETAAMAIVAIGGVAAVDDASIVGVVDDPIAIILIAGIATYVVVSNPDLVADTSEAVVSGIEGLRNWVREFAKANEGEQAQEVDRVNTKPNTSQPKRIAHVDDDEILRRNFYKSAIRLGGIEITSYSSCEALLVDLTANPVRYDLYILDNNLGRGNISGPICVGEIQAVHPGALIIGFSGGLENPFEGTGVRWINKNTSMQILEVIKELFK